MEKSSHSTPPTSTAVTAATGDSPSPFMTAPAASSTSSTNTSGSTASSGMQNPLRMLNKASHKISKPAAKPHQLPRCQSSLSATSQDAAEPQQATQPVPPPPPPSQQQPPQPPNNLAPPQPPVYNINKNDFRDVVQKLTGSTMHLNPRPPSAPAPPVKPATPPVMPPASATSSRLQRIRPPPLAQLGPRPPPLVHHPIPGPGVPAGPSALGGGICGGPETGGGYAWARPWISTPLSPLPPLPSVSAAAESPISAYMRRLQGGTGAAPNALLPLSPGPMGAPLFPLPSSPLGMGCLPSPRSAFQTTLPQSPRVPLPNPKMKDH